MVWQKNLTKHLGLGVGVEGREVNTVEGGLLPETRLAHSLSEQKSVGEGGQVHGTLVGEEVSTWLQERVAGIDETLDLTIPAVRQESLRVRFLEHYVRVSILVTTFDPHVHSPYHSLVNQQDT